MKKKAIYAGSFDPFHKGHKKIVEKALNLFDLVYIVITKNINKEAKLSWNERLEMIEKEFKGNDKVIVLLNKKQLTAEFAKDVNVQFLIRGIRNNTDFNYEYEMAKTNKALNTNIETIFFFAEEKDISISSTFINEVNKIKGDDNND